MAGLAIFGASGMIGSAVLAEALDRGHEVLAVARDHTKLTRRHPALRVLAGDVRDQATAAAGVAGQDVVINAVGGGHGDAAGHRATAEPAVRSLVAALRAAGPGRRLITVGGAGSLRTADGSLLRDYAGLSDTMRQIIRAGGDALDYLRTVTDVRWTTISPPARIGPGPRTGSYRSALDTLILAEDGTSAISTDDFAIAVLDEAERPEHVGRRFTVGY
ncbi:NAD(P)-dependent oxidoreductase [Catenuloplanes japonicus]|uniref:NAD(P)-dependent oxidoreductase n=1 Tax=Catenuloplanes japonicus TaxID=33876 RepID=UPI0005242DF3|nr:NAD(P)H-binding protein [Catenuloplanes japonicus]